MQESTTSVPVHTRDTLSPFVPCCQHFELLCTFPVRSLFPPRTTLTFLASPDSASARHHYRRRRPPPPSCERAGVWSRPVDTDTSSATRRSPRLPPRVRTA